MSDITRRIDNLKERLTTVYTTDADTNIYHTFDDCARYLDILPGNRATTTLGAVKGAGRDICSDCNDRETT